MENNSNVTVNENKEKKPSVFKTICSGIGSIALLWFCYMSITGGFDNEYEKTIYMDINPKAMGKKDSDNLAKFFTNRDSNPTVFRLYVKANGQIVVKDDIEKTYIQDATSIK